MTAPGEHEPVRVAAVALRFRAARPYAIAFDVLETLADLASLRARFEEVGQPPATS